MVQAAPQPNSGTQPASGVPQPGQILAGKYTVERVIGVGGMGVVVAAIQQPLQQRVAIKLLLPHVAANPEAMARFVREARTSSSIQSEHIARVLDVGTFENGSPYMVMEFLAGSDLSQLLQQRGRLPIAEAVDHVVQACEAVAQAHQLGIVHRDLKPSNLFLTRAHDGSPLVKVLDFGISKVTTPGADVALTATSFAFGTPMYMSPEQVRSTKHVDPRTDIWALGVILHELITGRMPFEGDTLTALSAAITADPARPLRRDCPEASADLEAAILRCLQKDVSGRFQTVVELARAIAPSGSARARALCQQLDRIAIPTLPASLPQGAPTSGQLGTPPPPQRSPRTLIALLALASIGAGLAGMLLVVSRFPSTPPAAASSASASSASASSASASSAPVASAVEPPPAPSASAIPSATVRGKPVKLTPGPRKNRNDVQDDRH